LTTCGNIFTYTLAKVLPTLIFCVMFKLLGLKNGCLQFTCSFLTWEYHRWIV